MDLQTAIKPQAIGLHLRFGDYLRNPATRAFHGLTAFDYYLSALDHVARLVDTDEVMLFSDEPERALDLFKNSQTEFRSVVVAPRTHSNLKDLLMLSNCAAIVCSNSTFSWWAGWLGSTIRDIPVVLPEPWFAEYRSEEEALYFPNAIRFHRDIQ
jgi:hypothetical protein